MFAVVCVLPVKMMLSPLNPGGLFPTQLLPLPHLLSVANPSQVAVAEVTVMVAEFAPESGCVSVAVTVIMSLPTIAPAPTVAVADAPPPAEAQPTPTPGEQVYVVKAGDSPSSIAQRFRVKTEDLVAYNHIEDPQRLQIGQTVRIPPPAAP